MKSSRLIAALGLLCTAPAFAAPEPDAPVVIGSVSLPCSTHLLAGRWMFATDVGHQNIFPGGQDITAIGVFRLDRQGTLLDGVFDANVYKTRFLAGITFTGSVVVNSNCTGTLTFVTSAGTTRTDSIVVLGTGLIRGMSQDVNNLWTYEMRRL